MSELPDPLRVQRECPGWFGWLDLAGWHARYLDEPKGTNPRVSATTQDGLIAAIRTAEKTPLPSRVPAPLPDGARALRWEPADPKILARVRVALLRLRSPH